MVLNRSFREMKKWMTPVVKEDLTHTQEVTRLYRASLKSLFDVVYVRSAYLEEARKIRAEFESNRNLTVEQGRYYLEKGRERLKANKAVDPYIVPWMPGGTKFMRNPTPHPSLVYAGEEMPEDAFTGTNTPMHLDSIPISIRPIKK